MKNNVYCIPYIVQLVVIHMDNKLDLTSVSCLIPIPISIDFSDRYKNLLLKIKYLTSSKLYSCNKVVMKKLTVIIPFLNEGEEIRNTVENIMANGGQEVELILINDASTDDYDYESVAREYKSRYVLHSERKGVAASRDEGVSLCGTPYFLLLDGHMRFYDSLWIGRIVSELEKDERQLLCCQTKVLREKGGVVFVESEQATGFGAKINICDDKELWDIKWLSKEREPKESVEEIPCVLGAAYAASKHYWEYLKGLQGLQYYGSDEMYISIKVWLEGGKCRLLKNVVAGHIYRDKFPYPVETKYTLYNKLFIGEVLVPPDLKSKIFSEYQKQNPEVFSKSYALLIENRETLKELRDWYRQIFINDFDLIVQLNTKR